MTFLWLSVLGHMAAGVLGAVVSADLTRNLGKLPWDDGKLQTVKHIRNAVAVLAVS